MFRAVLDDCSQPARGASRHRKAAGLLLAVGALGVVVMLHAAQVLGQRILGYALLDI